MTDISIVCDQAIIDELRETIAELCPETLQNADCFSDEDPTGSEDSQTNSSHLSIDLDHSQIQELESTVNSLFDLSPILESAKNISEYLGKIENLEKTVRNDADVAEAKCILSGVVLEC
jgi:hypothetical protein